MAEPRKQRTLGMLLFPRFELLDVCGPLEMFGHAEDAIRIVTVAEESGPVASTQRVGLIAETSFEDAPHLDLLLVPGGIGTRGEVDNADLLEWIADRGRQAEILASVCTGAALLARAGLLDGRRATTNKRSFAWVCEQGPRVQWIKQARWVEDANVFTSSGVAAGIDMALAVLARLFGQAWSEKLAETIEYEWHRDANWDPFARVHGLLP